MIGDANVLKNRQTISTLAILMAILCGVNAKITKNRDKNPLIFR